MNGSVTREENGKALRRLVALLLALADLAERASGRSGPVRHLVLWFLGSGEAIARDYVCGLAGNAACGPALVALPIAGRAIACGPVTPSGPSGHLPHRGGGGRRTWRLSLPSMGRVPTPDLFRGRRVGCKCPICDCPASAGEAGRLAASFRALAMALAAFAGASMAARPSGIGRTLDAALVAIAALKTFAAPPAAVERRDSS